MDLKLSEYRPVHQLVTPWHAVNVPRFPVIDVHTHFGPLVLGPEYEKAYDTGQVLQDLARFGVEKACNLELVWGGELERLNRKTAGQEGRLFTFPSVEVARFEEPGFEEDVRETLASYRKAGYKGIKLWKDITLYLKDKRGGRIRLDDPRLSCVFDAAGENGLIVLIHIADPKAFFTPFDGSNEYYECLVENPEWNFSGPGHFSFQEHMAMQETVLSRHPGTTFIIAHGGSCSEDLGYVAGLLDRFPNLYIDIAARINELGRQPYTARRFFIRYADRVLFGTDYAAGQDPAELYPFYYRFLETFDEYFDYAPPGSENSLGRWKIYGVGLPDDALRLIYRDNAARLLGLG